MLLMNMNVSLSVGSQVDAYGAGGKGRGEEHLGPILDLRIVRAAARPIWPKMSKNQISLTGVRAKENQKARKEANSNPKFKFKFSGKDDFKGKDGKGKSKTFQTSDERGTSSSKPTSSVAKEPQDPRMTGPAQMMHTGRVISTYESWYLTVDATSSATKDGLNIAQPYAMASAVPRTRLSQVLEPAKYPSHVILDNGCTKSMGSWYAVERFVHAVRESGNPNISCWYEPGDTTFTFANGQIGKAKYKLAI